MPVVDVVVSVETVGFAFQQTSGFDPAKATKVPISQALPVVETQEDSSTKYPKDTQPILLPLVALVLPLGEQDTPRTVTMVARGIARSAITPGDLDRRKKERKV